MGNSISSVISRSSGTTRTMDVFNTDKEPVTIECRSMKRLASGTFGEVRTAYIHQTNHEQSAQAVLMAIKTVHQDHRYKSRELEILLRLRHSNTIRMCYYYETQIKGKDYLSIIMEYLPTTLEKIRKRSSYPLPLILIRLFVYQLLKGLQYIHGIGICHRDIKPSNLLVSEETAVLKIADFGSAKPIGEGKNKSYICSRYYRAPELILDCTTYGAAVDIWAAGCVAAELMLCDVLFKADGSEWEPQISEIITLKGVPTQAQLDAMRPSPRRSGPFPVHDSTAGNWEKRFADVDKEGFHLCTAMLDFDPDKRLCGDHALKHPFFTPLKEENVKLPNNGGPLPPL